jgi:hypothetical protein
MTVTGCGGGDDDTTAGAGDERASPVADADAAGAGSAAGAVAGRGPSTTGAAGGTGTTAAPLTIPEPDGPPDTSGSVDRSTSGGCTGPGTSVPAGGGTSSADVGDVDGDGRADRAWFTSGGGPVQLGVSTAAGGGGAVTSSLTAAPLSLVVADADASGPVELFLADGRTAELWAFSGCALEPVIGPDGLPFLFDLGVRGNGTGVGCVAVGGSDRLVGLDVTEDDGTTVRWRRTVIELDGLSATIGDAETGTFARPGDDHAIGLLHTVSCGDAVAAGGRVVAP